MADARDSQGLEPVSKGCAFPDSSHEQEPPAGPGANGGMPALMVAMAISASASFSLHDSLMIIAGAV